MCSVSLVVCRLMMPVISLCAVLAHGPEVLAQDEVSLLRRGLTAYKEYTNIRITGTATRYVNDGIVEEVPFTANYGDLVDGKAPVYEIGHRIPNPGEPHLPESEIFIKAVAEFDAITVEFNRELIGKSPVAERKSSVILSKINGCVPPLHFVSLAILSDYFGIEPRNNVGQVTQGLELISLNVIGKETLFGLDVLRVQVTRSMKDTSMPDAPPLMLESLVATEPTFQVVQHVSAEGGPAGWLDQHGMREQYLARKVESARVINQWLVCDKVRFPSHDGSWLIEIDDVESLPKGYVGLWDINALTGVTFTGPLEAATRPGSPRLTMEHTRNATYIPFTQEEQEKIRQFVIGETSPVQQKLAWDRIVFWAVNLLALLFLGYSGYRRYRYG